MSRSFHNWLTPNLPTPAETWQDGLRGFAIFIVYFLLVKLSYLAAAQTNAPALIWLPDGVAIGMLWLFPRRTAFVGAIAVLFANLLNATLGGMALMPAILGSVVNVLQVAASVWLMARETGQPVRRLALRSQLPFFLGVVLVINAAAAAAHAFIGSVYAKSAFAADFVSHAVSDALGIVLATPLIVSWGMYYVADRAGVLARKPVPLLRMVEGIVVALGTVLVTIWVFGSDHGEILAAKGLRPFVYFCLPFLIWIALRFDLRAVTLSLFVTAVIAIALTATGTGQFVLGNNSLALAIAELQLFLVVLSVTVLIAAGLTSDQRATSRAAEETRNRYDEVMRASGNVAFEINLVTRAVTWSGDTFAVLGWHPSEINTIDRWTEKVHVDDRDGLLGIRKRLASGNVASINLEYRVERPDGSYIKLSVGAFGSAFAIQARANQDPKHIRTIVGLAKDITATAAVAEEKAKLEGALRQAQKMEAIGQMAGGIAHDFNNVLAAILGYGEMMREKLKKATGLDEKTSSSFARYLETIISAGERGRLMVAQILTFSRRAPEKKSRVSLNTLLHEVVGLLRGSYKHEIMLDIEEPERDRSVFGDATALHQLAMNISTNGLQAMADNPDGVLSIHLSDVEFAEGRVLPNGALQSGRYAMIKIADEGSGIDEATRAKMFDPFFTTKEIGKGTGLGLSLALAIARTHDGAIAVDSAAGEGSVFTIYLPYVDSLYTDASVEKTDVPEGSGEIIMLVDDEDALRELGAEILTSLNYKPMVFDSSAQAWATFQQSPDLFRAIVTDEVMPELTGTQLAERIHALRPNLPILIITAYGGTGFELRAQRAGVSAILAKPYRTDDLARHLAAALSAKTDAH